jgi:hypothetical protein
MSIDAHVTQESELDRRTRDAWEGYRIACGEVAAADYEETELIAWDLLQHELRAVAADRLELETAAAFADEAA